MNFMMTLSKIKKRLLSLLLILSTLLVTNVISHAALPDVIIENERLIDINNPRFFEVYIPYGNTQNNKIVENVTLKVTLKGGGIELTGNEIVDYVFNEEMKNRYEILKNYDYLDCSLIPKLKNIKDKQLTGGVISKEFFTSNELNKYSPGSAGATGSSDTKSLQPGQTGCLELKIKASGKGNAGDINKIYGITEGDFESEFKPGITSISFILDDGKIRCDTDKIYVSGNCVSKTCPTYQVHSTALGDNGKCNYQVKVCQDNLLEEVEIGGIKRCAPQCQKDEVRTELLECTKATISKEQSGISKIWNEVYNTGLFAFAVAVGGTLGLISLISHLIKWKSR